LALLVSVAGGQFWNIVRFLVHQLRAREKKSSRDGLFHQQQVVLRNTGSSFSVAWELSRASFKWRKDTKHPYFRSLLLIGLTILVLVTFAIAGIFSSQVTKAVGNEALTRGQVCGSWDIPVTDAASNEAWQSKVLNETINAATYARNCYGTAQDNLKCRSYVQQQISWKTNSNATCPFASGMCYFSDTAAYEMDTGPIDSHQGFGLNGPQSERITYRKVTTCAPLHTKGFARLENATVTNSGTQAVAQFIRIYFGPNGNGASNWTYQYNINAVLDGFGYQLT
jgi:hypothetical protein